jgi:hypothetical protein
MLTVADARQREQGEDFVLAPFPLGSRGEEMSQVSFEARSFPRHEVMIEGKIVSPSLAASIPCVMRNLSEAGAFVTTKARVSIPHRVYLWQAGTRTIFECAVRWQKSGKMFGLHFTDTGGLPARRALIAAASAPPASSSVVTVGEFRGRHQPGRGMQEVHPVEESCRFRQVS